MRQNVRTSRAPWVALALCLLAPACAADPLLQAQSDDCANGDCSAGPSSNGDDPANFCDDENPCTDDANCTPCSTLPAAERDIYHCTADDELPAFCAGKTGCVHVAWSDPPGQVDGCFPVAGAAEPHPGMCRVGRCVENDG